MSGRSAFVYSSEYLGYKLSDEHPLNPIRLALTESLIDACGLLDGPDVFRADARMVTDDEIMYAHDRDYMERVRDLGHAPRFANPALDFGLGTGDNPVFPNMHESSGLVVGGSLVAAELVMSGQATHTFNPGGGLHHADRRRASGFCVYNDCAVAISWLLDHGFDRIAYVDVDVHHGDGVQAAFYADPRVLTISLHQHPMTLWPGTGWPGEYGEGPGAGYAVNVPLPPGTADSGWLRAFHAVVPSLLGAFRPQVLLTQCGVDTHAEDPLANLGLSVDGHRAIYRALRDFAGEFAEGRWLAVGGGGYGLFRVVPRSWTHLVATVLDRDVAPNRPLPADWVAHTAGLTRQQLPTAMTDGRSTVYEPWTEGADRVDAAVLETRRAVFPLHGLDPHDPRD